MDLNSKYKIAFGYYGQSDEFSNKNSKYYCLGYLVVKELSEGTCSSCGTRHAMRNVRLPEHIKVDIKIKNTKIVQMMDSDDCKTRDIGFNLLLSEPDIKPIVEEIKQYLNII